MEISSLSNLAELGTEDSYFFHDQWPEHLLDGVGFISFGSSFRHEDLHQLSYLQPEQGHERTPGQTEYESKRPINHLEASKNLGSKGNLKTKVEPLNVLNYSPESIVLESSFGSKNCVQRPVTGAKRISTCDVIPKDHVLAERKRRENVTQRLIALSALLPGLEKMDKASILEDAIKHVKQLQEKVKILEEQTKQKSIESVVFVEKYLHLSDGSENSSSDKSCPDIIAEPLPEIEARVSNNDVLINILCEKRNGLLEKTVADEIGKFHLSVVNSSAMAFGGSLYIAVMAKKDEESTLNPKELVQKLSSALKTVS